MTDLFKGYGIISGGILHVSPKEAFELIKRGAIMVDVREGYLDTFKTFDVSGVIYLPESKLENEFKNLPVNKYLIVADSVGLRSKEAALFLINKGYKKIANMAGGIVDWERDGLPVLSDISARLSGSCMCQLKPREGRKAKK
jgi:rhodanese-related sulfurtransferase